jgi:ABC-type multidrug transport system fused ATPase/permease subunit
MSVYLRILRYLRPHAAVFLLSVAAMVVYAALDAFSFTLLIPFLGVLFKGGSGLPTGDVLGGGSDVVHRLLQWAVGDLVELTSPMTALRNVVLLLFAIFLVKNVALYVQQYTVALVQGIFVQWLDVRLPAGPWGF